MKCDYCDAKAILRIPAVRGEACLEHTIKFWTGFMQYAKDHPVPAAVIPALQAA